MLDRTNFPSDLNFSLPDQQTHDKSILTSFQIVLRRCNLTPYRLFTATRLLYNMSSLMYTMRGLE